MITPGIYKHYKGNLYYVQGVAYNREDPTNIDKGTVIYHPLYQVPNQGWRYNISPTKFIETIERGEYLGPRFREVMWWHVANLLPGCVWIDPRLEIGNTGKETHLTILSVVADDECMATVLLKDYKGRTVFRRITDLILYCIYSNIKESTA